MSRSELPTEPEIPRSAERREAALRAWCERHRPPLSLRALLTGVVHGLHAGAIGRRLGIAVDDLVVLEGEFERRFQRSVHQVAAEILNEAYAA